MALHPHLPATVDATHRDSFTRKSRRSADQWHMPVAKSLNNIRRVIVLVPGEEIDEETMLEKVRSSTPTNAKEMVFVGLNSNPAIAPAHHRRLSWLASRARGRIRIVAYGHLLRGSDWAEAVQKIARPDDAVMTSVEIGRGVEQSLSSLALPVYLMVGLRPPRLRRFQRAVRRMVFEVLPLLIVAGFFWLQVQIANQTDGALTTILTIMTVLFEIGLLFVWSLFLS